MAFEREGGLCQRPQSSRSVADGSRLAGVQPESVARRSTLGDRERHVEGLRPALQEHGHAVAALEPLRRPLEVLHGAHALAVDLADHVAALQARLGGRAVLVHPRHHHAFGRAQVELAGDLRSQGPRVETQEALALAARLGRLRGRLGCLADLDLACFLAIVAPHIYWDALAGGSTVCYTSAYRG